MVVVVVVVAAAVLVVVADGVVSAVSGNGFFASVFSFGTGFLEVCVTVTGNGNFCYIFLYFST